MFKVFKTVLHLDLGLKTGRMEAKAEGDNEARRDRRRSHIWKYADMVLGTAAYATLERREAMHFN